MLQSRLYQSHGKHYLTFFNLPRPAATATAATAAAATAATATA